MIVLAHRGWWREPGERNTLAAFEAAFQAGFGIETDVRDCDGTLVIAHDPPTGRERLGFEAVLDLYARSGRPGALAVNIKADGLQPMVEAALAAADIDNAFVFDMSVPDALRWLRTGLATFTRQSEYEPHPSFYDAAAGVWMDGFESDWITAEQIAAHVANGKRAALVSPELHGRPHRAVWSAWAPARDLPGVMICTDFPDEARRVLG